MLLDGGLSQASCGRIQSGTPDLYENHSSDCELLRLIVARSEYREGELREQRGREIEGGIRMMDRGREGWDSGAEE